MPAIHTLTANLLAETTAAYPQVRLGATQRAEAVSFQVGGKGINVAKMAQRLGARAQAVYFPGGSSGQRCREWLGDQRFAHRAIPVEAPTREGWVVRDASNGQETTFLGVSEPLPLDAWTEGLAALGHGRQASLAICGSIPGWTPAHAAAVAEVFPLWQCARHFLALDTYGPALPDLVTLPWDLVKINQSEWAGLAETRGWPTEPAAGLVEARSHCPVRQWIVTDGPARIWVATDEHLYRLQPPPLEEEVSPTGCGDVLLAALLVALAQGADLPEALCFAVPFARANAADPGVADFALAGIEPLEPTCLERVKT